jgi:hypothetical protein
LCISKADEIECDFVFQVLEKIVALNFDSFEDLVKSTGISNQKLISLKKILLQRVLKRGTTAAQLEQV